MEKINLCKNCIYYFKDNFIKEHALCLKYGKKKWFEFEKTIDVRNNPKKCGQDGKQFIENLERKDR